MKSPEGEHEEGRAEQAGGPYGLPRQAHPRPIDPGVSGQPEGRGGPLGGLGPIPPVEWPKESVDARGREGGDQEHGAQTTEDEESRERHGRGAGHGGERIDPSVGSVERRHHRAAGTIAGINAAITLLTAGMIPITVKTHLIK